MKQLISEYEITKTILRKISEGVLAEEKNDSITISGAEKRMEEDKFVQAVTPRATFDNLIVYPYDNNVVWRGTLSNGIKWRMSKNDDLSIDASGAEIDDEEMEVIIKLKKYREVWVDDWSTKLRTEYKVNSYE